MINRHFIYPVSNAFRKRILGIGRDSIIGVVKCTYIDITMISTRRSPITIVWTIANLS
jgi:hypothetical protein